MIANHASTRSTQLYDPRNDEVSLKPVLKGCAGRLDEGWAIVVTAFWGALWLGGFYVDA
jgi:hypothetical protein